MNLYLFDCFGVVVSDVSTLWMKAENFSDEQTAQARKLFRKVDCGEVSFEDSFDVLAQMCGKSKQAVRKRWDSLLYPFPDTLALIEKLRCRGKVALLSNADSSYVKAIFRSFGLDRYFDRVFVSSDYGVAKPDERFYALCLAAFTQKFDKVYFTDDNPINLESAKKLGIETVLFTSAKQATALLT